MASLRKRGKVWYVRYRDAHGKQIETKAGPDRSMAQRIANTLESQVHAIRTGTADPREAGWAEAERKPLAEHVHDWRCYLVSKGGTVQHADQSRERVLRLIESAKILRISGLSIGTVQAALAAIRQTKGRRGRARLSDSSTAYYARAIKSFSRWLWRDGRVRDDALVHLALPDINDKHTRQALSPEEAAALIAVTPTQPVRSGVSGQDRAMFYAVALGTGLRLSELLSLTPESFDLDSETPTIFCSGKHTKNGKDALQPIRPELAAMLRPWLADKTLGKPVFTLRRDYAAQVVRSDLAAAGIAHSESYDLHCLRHTYITMVVKSGASVKVCQELARHASPTLTMNVYSHLAIHDTAKGLDGLAHILPTPCVSKGLTGTDGNPVISRPIASREDPSRHASRRVRSWRQGLAGIFG